ncbi:MAG: hypothetical protein NT129_01455 [Candidatus Aenigmarchaeota archaeon]|nr:hypothetical protein [Candidatus Aenigmarchaeota archaeon]
MLPNKLFSDKVIEGPVDDTKTQGFGYGSFAMCCCHLGNITPGDIVLIGKKYPANFEEALAGQPYKVVAPTILQRYDPFEIPGATGSCFIKGKYVPAKEVLEQVPWEKLSPGELAKIYLLPGITSSKKQ